MAPGRTCTRGDTFTLGKGHRTHAGVQKNTRNRQAPNHYCQQRPASLGTPATTDTYEPSSSPKEAAPSIPQYSHSLSSIERVKATLTRSQPQAGNPGDSRMTK